MVDRPIQLVGDDAEVNQTIRVTDTPTDTERTVPMTEASGRMHTDFLPLEIAVDRLAIDGAETLTIHGAEYVVALNVQSDSVGSLACQTVSGTRPSFIYGARSQTADAIVQDGDSLRQDVALGWDGVDFEMAGYTIWAVDGTPDADVMPCRWDLFVTPAAAFTPELAVTVRADKHVTLGGRLTTVGVITPPATQRLIGALVEVVDAEDLVDGGGAVGTKVLAGTIPVGARIIGCDVTVEAGFAGDVSATIMIGDGVDDDRYMTGTPSVFATAADGIAIGIPSGAVNVLVANTPTVTITSDANITAVLAGGGSLTVRIYYVPRS